MVDGDPEQLDRVLINLLSNAVKYTPRHGSVRLTATREDGCALLTVADTGVGIPEQDQKSLFTPFFRASNAVDRAVPGSGLGLSIVRTVVTNHHGEVSLNSTEGHGTTIMVRIPLLDGAGQAAPAGAARNRERPLSTSRAGPRTPRPRKGAVPSAASRAPPVKPAST
jgi:two-component system phosphate regulon sensor histidine kinase PhoR